jgi:serine/threonine protein kinase
MDPEIVRSGTAPGMTLGGYRIERLLGRGGMGSVFLAYDTTLHRQVALKVLDATFDGETTHARLLREARNAAALNHPNICTIHEVGDANGAAFIAMEYVEGRSLRDWLDEGPLPLADAVGCARQAADALAYAHDHGVIHRDFKAANAIISGAGRLKVVDFGLARRRDERTAETTTVASVVAAGTAAGTPYAMAPEQVRGDPADGRTDIWALGVLMYEMVSGTKPFLAATIPELFSSILRDAPAPLPQAVPVALKILIERCLQKGPDQRYQLAGEVRSALEAIGAGAATPPVGKRNPGRRRGGLVAAASVLGAAAMLLGWQLGSVRGWIPGRSLETPPGPEQWVQLTNFPDSVGQPALSPDGQMLTFVCGPGVLQVPGQIYVKQLPNGEPRALTNDSLRKASPVFSPDGSQIAYTTISDQNDWDTWIVSAVGGQPTPWLRNASGLVWIDRQRLLFSKIKSGVHMAIVTADQTRAQERDVYVPTHERGMGHRSYLSPDGSSALIVEMDGSGAWIPCRLVPLDGTSPGRQIGPRDGGCTSGGWSPDGKWIYLASNSGGAQHIWRQAVGTDVAERITSGPTDEEGIAVAPDGRSIVTAIGLTHRPLVFSSDKGNQEVSPEGYTFNPKFSRDGKTVFYQLFKAASDRSGPSELWMADVATGARQMLYPAIASAGLGSSAGGGSYDVSADGRRVVLTAGDPQGRPRLWLVAVDRSVPPYQIPAVEGHQPTFGPNNEIVFRVQEDRRTYLYRVREDGSGLRKAIPEPAEIYGMSLDGRLLIAWRPSGGTFAYPMDGGAPVQVFRRDLRLRWSADGRALFASVGSTGGTLYGSGRTYVIPLSKDGTLSAIPTGGFQSEAAMARIPGVQVIEAADVGPGPRSDVYAFSRETTQRNLYRIPIR